MSRWVNDLGLVQLAALLGAAGAGSALLARSRLPLLAGFAAVAASLAVLGRSSVGAPSTQATYVSSLK